MLGAINVPIVYMSVRWWRTIHQIQSSPATVDPAYVVGLRLNAFAMLFVMIFFIRRRYEAARFERMAEHAIERAALGTGEARSMSNWMFVVAAFAATWIALSRLSRPFATSDAPLTSAASSARAWRRIDEHRRHAKAIPHRRRSSSSSATFGYLLYGGIDQNVVYFLTPHELLAKGTRAVDVPVRLGGQVKPGSVKWNDSTLDLHFTITDGTTRNRGRVARRAAADVPRRHGRRGRRTLSAQRRVQLHEPHGEALERISSAEAG